MTTRKDSDNSTHFDVVLKIQFPSDPLEMPWCPGPRYPRKRGRSDRYAVVAPDKSNKKEYAGTIRQCLWLGAVRSAGTVRRVLPAPRPRGALLQQRIPDALPRPQTDEIYWHHSFARSVTTSTNLRSSFGNKSRYHRRNQLEAIPAATLIFHIAEMCRMATLVAYVSAVYMSDHATELKA
jgi:hypothetical protein